MPRALDVWTQAWRKLPAVVTGGPLTSQAGSPLKVVVQELFPKIFVHVEPSLRTYRTIARREVDSDETKAIVTAVQTAAPRLAWLTRCYAELDRAYRNENLAARLHGSNNERKPQLLRLAWSLSAVDEARTGSLESAALSAVREYYGETTSTTAQLRALLMDPEFRSVADTYLSECAAEHAHGSAPIPLDVPYELLTLIAWTGDQYCVTQPSLANELWARLLDNEAWDWSVLIRAIEFPEPGHVRLVGNSDQYGPAGSIQSRVSHVIRKLSTSARTSLREAVLLEIRRANYPLGLRQPASRATMLLGIAHSTTLVLTHHFVANNTKQVDRPELSWWAANVQGRNSATDLRITDPTPSFMARLWPRIHWQECTGRTPDTLLDAWSIIRSVRKAWIRDTQSLHSPNEVQYDDATERELSRLDPTADSETIMRIIDTLESANSIVRGSETFLRDVALQLAPDLELGSRWAQLVDAAAETNLDRRDSEAQAFPTFRCVAAVVRRHYRAAPGIGQNE